MRKNKIKNIEIIDDYAIIHMENDKFFYIDTEYIDKIKDKNWTVCGNRVFYKYNNVRTELSKLIFGNNKETIYKRDQSIPDYRIRNLTFGIKGNVIRLYDNYAEIIVDNCSLIVDLEDTEKIRQFTWRLDKDGYATASTKRDENNKQQQYRMHRLILNVTDPKIIVDHIDRNKTNNRKNNFRIVTYQQNTFNRSKIKNSSSSYKGLYFDKKHNAYQLRIFKDGKSFYFGTYTSEIAAANAYNYYIIQFFGEYSVFNDVTYMDKEEWEQYKNNYNKTSKYRGVSLNKNGKFWRVVAQDKNRKVTYVGTYKTEDEAALAYNTYIITEFGYENIQSKLNNTNFDKVI